MIKSYKTFKESHDTNDVFYIRIRKEDLLCDINYNENLFIKEGFDNDIIIDNVKSYLKERITKNNFEFLYFRPNIINCIINKIYYIELHSIEFIGHNKDILKISKFYGLNIEDTKPKQPKRIIKASSPLTYDHDVNWFSIKKLI